MRDIALIRKQVASKEQNGSGTPRTYTKEVRTIQTLRNDQIKNDGGTQLILDKVKTNKKLSETIQSKKKDLQTLAEAAKSIQEGAKQEADRIIKEATQKASDLITQVSQDRDKARNLLEEHQNKKLELEALEQEVSKRETNVKESELSVDIAQKDVHKKQESVDKLLESATEKNKQAVDIFVNVFSLFEIAIEFASQAQKLNSEAELVVSQTLAKAGRIMERTAAMVKEVDAGKSILSKKATELQEWQYGLVDRERTLDRAAKELNQK